MRKGLLATALALLGAADPACASWIRLGQNIDGDVFYADPSTLRKSGHKRRVWIMTDYSSPSAGIRSGKAHREFDCEQGRERYLQLRLYTGPRGSGTVVHRAPVDEDWSHPPPDSAVDQMLALFCKH